MLKMMESKPAVKIAVRIGTIVGRKRGNCRAVLATRSGDSKFFRKMPRRV